MKKTILAMAGLMTALCAGAAGTNATCAATTAEASLLGELDTGIYGDGSVYGLGASFLTLGLERGADGVSALSPLLGLTRADSYADYAAVVDVSVFSVLPPARCTDGLLVSGMGNPLLKRMELRGGMASLVNFMSQQAKASGVIAGAVNWGMAENAWSGICVGGLVNMLGLEDGLDDTSERLLRNSLGGAAVDMMKQIADARGTMSGVAVAGLGNAMKCADVSGVQIACLVNTAGTLDGVQIGCFNEAQSGSFLQVGLVNQVHGPMKGVQIGLFNVYGEDGVLPVLHAGF